MGASVQPQLLAPNWWLGILPPEYYGRKKTFFGYEADFIGIAALTTVSVQTQIASDSAFFAMGMNALVTDQATPPTLIWGGAMTTANTAQMLVNISDAGTQTNFFPNQTPPPLDNVGGSGPFPAPFAFPYLFPASGTIVTTLTSLVNAVRNVRCTFYGVRIWNQ